MCGGEYIYFWRQLFVVSATFFGSMSVSFVLSFPAVLNLGILSANTTDISATPDEASWIAATSGIFGIFSYFLHSISIVYFGRRMDSIITNLVIVAGWVFIIFANSVPILIVGRALHGLILGGIFIHSLLISEFVDSSRRGYFTSVKKIFGATGALLSHALTFVLTWRQVAGIAMIPSLVSIGITCFWPETPAHLASKGRFEECEKSFYWLHKYSISSEKELNEMVAAQIQLREIKKQRTMIKIIKDKAFLKTLLLVGLLTIILDACGRYYFIAYIIQIMMEVTGDKSVATYCSIGGDCLAILALFVSCFVIKIFKRRTVIFILGGFSVFLMFSLFLIKFVHPEDKWLIASVILLHYFIVNLSLIPVSYTLFGELFSIECRGIGTCLSGIIFAIFYSITMKITPILMQHTGIAGTYSVFGIIVIFCLVILYFTLPETKDKTLQEIDDEMKGIQRNVTEIRPMLRNLVHSKPMLIEHNKV